MTRIIYCRIVVILLLASLLFWGCRKDGDSSEKSYSWYPNISDTTRVHAGEDLLISVEISEIVDRIIFCLDGKEVCSTPNPTNKLSFTIPTSLLSVGPHIVTMTGEYERAKSEKQFIVYVLEANKTDVNCELTCNEDELREFVSGTSKSIDAKTKVDATITLFINGEKKKSVTNVLTYDLSNMDVGVYTIKVEAVAANGKTETKEFKCKVKYSQELTLDCIEVNQVYLGLAKKLSARTNLDASITLFINGESKCMGTSELVYDLSSLTVGTYKVMIEAVTKDEQRVSKEFSCTIKELLIKTNKDELTTVYYGTERYLEASVDIDTMIVLFVDDERKTYGNRSIKYNFSDLSLGTHEVLIKSAGRIVSWTCNVEKKPYYPDEIVVEISGVEYAKLIRVEGGEFYMGAQDYDANASDYFDAAHYELPRHKVTLNDYYIGQSEVSIALFNVVMGTSNGSENGNLPAVFKSYGEVIAFLSKLNQQTNRLFRLPTEAEWEYAARGGKKESVCFKYSGSNEIRDVAWYCENSDNHAHPVMSKKGNALGLFDMSGNLSEWCQDFFGDYQNGSQINPQGPSSGDKRVLRGGSWNSKELNARVYKRVKESSENTEEYGIRLVLTN